MILACKLWTLYAKDLVESDILAWGDIERRSTSFLDLQLWILYD
jgi:hypothetical protein